MTQSTNQGGSQGANRGLAYMQLVRIPNVFTAVADIMTGFLIVQGSLQPAGPFFTLLISSCCLYCAGMVLNDVFDVEEDREKRPERPLPSGAIAVDDARKLGIGLLAVGVIGGWVAGVFMGPASMAVRSGAVATVLAALVWLYNSPLKNTPLAPVVMGACRALNVMLGMVLVATPSDYSVFLGLEPHHLAAAGAMGLYIIGITIYASEEDNPQSRLPLILGTLLMGVALIIITSLGEIAPYLEVRVKIEVRWFIMAFIGYWILRTCYDGIYDPTARNVQEAVGYALSNLIVLHAVIIGQFAAPQFVLMTVALAIPTAQLRKLVYQT